MGLLGKVGKGLGKGALAKGGAGLGGGQALGKVAQLGKAGLQAVGGPQGVVDIVNQSIQMGNNQAADITGQVVSLLQGLMQNRPA